MHIHAGVALREALVNVSSLIGDVTAAHNVSQWAVGDASAGSLDALLSSSVNFTEVDI